MSGSRMHPSASAQAQRIVGDELVDRFERNAAAAFAPLRIAPLGHREFDGAWAGYELGDVMVSRIRATSYQVSRRAADITSGDRELVKVQVQHSGIGRIEQSDRQAVGAPGSMIAYETTAPYRVAFDGINDVTVLGVPRERLGRYADRLSSLTAVTMPGFAPFLHTIESIFGLRRAAPLALEGDTAEHLGEALVSLVLAGIDSGAENGLPQRRTPGQRILAFCEANLTDPRLGAAYIAQVMGVSERQVYKLAAAEGIRLAAWIRDRRLEGIRDDLADPSCADTELSSIVMNWGLTDSAHISRSLRARFGVSAMELRHRARESVHDGDTEQGDDDGRQHRAG